MFVMEDRNMCIATGGSFLIFFLENEIELLKLLLTLSVFFNISSVNVSVYLYYVNVRRIICGWCDIEKDSKQPKLISESYKNYNVFRIIT